MDLEQLSPERKKVWDKINQMMDVSYGCAESFVAAVGEHLWGEVETPIQMISTGFSGGVGGTHEEVCGGVSGSAIILGLLYGRTTNDEALMIRCKRLISEQRDRFVQEFGTTVCQELRDAQFGADEDNPCSAMIAPAAFMLLDILEEEKEREALAQEKQKSTPKVEILSFEEYKKTHADDEPKVLIKQLERIEIPHDFRNWIGERLDDLRDARPGVSLSDDSIPDISWIPVPAGVVDIERAGEFRADQLFIAKYPVTCLQFQAFLDDTDGFTNPAWWQGLGVEDDQKNKPGEQRFQFGNHPRENVSWYDAVAYCRWLTDKFNRSELTGEMESEIIDLIKEDNWEIRLPTEWEWKMAATGGNKENKFPWGMDWDESLAHTKHNQLNKTMAVGMYPAGVSKTGAFDMSGNVWEWCLNSYETPEDIDMSRVDRRVLRGGSWYHWGSYAHTEMRSRYYPDHRYNAGGFRVACGKLLVR